MNHLCMYELMFVCVYPGTKHVYIFIFHECECIRAHMSSYIIFCYMCFVCVTIDDVLGLVLLQFISKHLMFDSFEIR